MPAQDTRSSRGVLRFSSFEVDVRARELRKHGIRIKLQDQPFRLLRLLLERPGEVITREELQRQIWPADTFVDFDRGLNNAVKRLREALADSAEQPRYIETLPKCGYRFIGPVHSANGNGTNTKVLDLPLEKISQVESEETSHTRAWRATVYAMAGAATLVLLLALAIRSESVRNRFMKKPASLPIRSIAVLPLQNLSGDPNQEYLADGMTEELITDLSQVSALRVASHQSVLRYRNSAEALPGIARELNVDALVSGSVQRIGDRMRVSAHLVYAAEDKILWARSYERDFRDALALQANVAAGIVDEIRINVTAKEQTRPAAQQIDPKILEKYWELKFHSGQAWDAAWQKHRGKLESDQEYFKAVSSFEELTRLDPNCIPAYLALAQQVVDMPRIDLASKAEAGLTRAIAIDESEPQVHVLLGDLLTLFDAQWDAAGIQFKRAVELKPDSAEIHEAYALYLDDFGRFEEGLKEHRIAQALDPHDDYLSWSPLLSPAERVKLKRQFTPGDSYHYWWRGNAEYEIGAYADAFQDWQRGFRDFSWDQEADSIAQAYALGGPEAGVKEMAKILDQIGNRRWIAPDVIIDAQFYAKNRESILGWLEKAYERRDQVILHLRSDHRWDPYRSDPRFKSIAERVGLAK